MRIFEITLSAIFGATLGVALTYFILDGRISAIETNVDRLTPVAVVDFLSIAENAPTKGLPSDELEEKISGLKSRVGNLEEKGFLILRKETLYSSPEGLIIGDSDGE